MAQIACKYHNERPAKWYCEACLIYFCSSCIPKKVSHDSVHCPVCHAQVSTVAAENSIDSFWNRLPSFFLYPVNFTSLLFLFVLSMISIGIEYDPILAISIPIVIIVLFLRYACMTLEYTARGHKGVPTFSVDRLFIHLDLPLKQILIIVATIAFNFTVYDLFGLGAFMFTLVFSIVASPACIMVLVTENSFFKAFNPLVVGTLITRIGNPYFILCAFLSLLLISSEVSFSILSNIIPVQYLWPGFFFISMYFVLIMYNMMGYFIFQYHEKLGYEIEVDLENHHAVDDTVHDVHKSDAIIQAEILLKEGKSDIALEKLSQAIKLSPADFTVRDMYHKLLKAMGKQDALALHTSGYIERLLVDKKHAKAIDILLDTRELISNYIPDKAKSRFELAIELNKQNSSELALACVNNLHRDFPSYEGIPKAYFLAAKIMCEKLGDDKKAIKVLQFVLTNYSGTVLHEEISNYIEMIKTLANKTVG